MKKIVFYVMTTLLATTAFASTDDSICAGDTAAVNMAQARSASFDIVLDAADVNAMLGITDMDKAERVSTYCRRFADDMASMKCRRESQWPERMVMAVYRNLARMMDVLTREEYHNYLLYINEVLGEKDLAQYFD